MNKIILLLSSLLLFTGCSQPISVNFESVDSQANNLLIEEDLKQKEQEVASQPSAISEYCFDLGGDLALVAERRVCQDKETTECTNGPIAPDEFLAEKPADYLAAINGVYWGADDGLPQGIFFINNKELSTRKGLISGYLKVTKKNEVIVSDVFVYDYPNYNMVIGTHPILVRDSLVDKQAEQNRYNQDSQGNKKKSFRSAIGSKKGNDICLAVSNSSLTMAEWASLLVKNGYQSALNLDGGPISQLAVREGNKINVLGGGGLPTRLIIAAQKK